MKRKNPTHHVPAQCKICGHNSPSYAGLASHLRNAHNISPQAYFDQYIEHFEHKCIYCGSPNVKFINMRVGYATSCASPECRLKASKKTKFEKYGDQNYSNREKFKATVKNLKADPEWAANVAKKQRETIAKHKREDPDYEQKRILKTRATKLHKYGDEFYTGKEKRLETLMNKYGVTNVFQLEAVKEKIKASLVEKYGVEYSMQLDSFKEKRVKTYLEKYGVDNPSKLPANREQAKRTTEEKYGNANYRNIEQQKKTNAKKTKAERDAIIQKRINFNLEHYGVATTFAIHPSYKSISKLSNRIKAIIDNHGVKNYESEFRIDYFDESLNCHRFRRYDFKFGNVLLELNGDYFHANPLKYKAKDVLRIHHKDIEVQSIWNDDLLKKQLAESYGYKIVYLWEADMKKMNDNELYNWLCQNIENFPV